MTINFGLPKEFDTFILREFESTDARALADIEYDPELKKYFKLPENPIEKFISGFNPRGYALESLPEKALAGTISCDRSGYIEKEFELRIFIAQKYQKKRIGYQAAKYFIECIFSVDWVPSVIGVVHPENEASQALMRALGFDSVGKASDKVNDLFRLKNGTA